MQVRYRAGLGFRAEGGDEQELVQLHAGYEHCEGCNLLLVAVLAGFMQQAEVRPCERACQVVTNRSVCT